MTIKLLKSMLKFWQEIAFIISLGILLIDMSARFSVVFQQLFSIICFCSFLVLLICLIGQFFWKNVALSCVLSIILGLSSFVFIFMCLSFLYTSPKIITGVAMLVFGVFLVIAAITMPIKYPLNTIEAK